MRTETERKAIWQSHGGLAIKLNELSFNGPCGICGDRTDFVAGPEVMLGDSNALVCRNCARRYEPEIVKLLAVEPNYYGDCPTVIEEETHRPESMQNKYGAMRDSRLGPEEIWF